MRIIGILLVQNEERFVRRAIENVIAFCDELILCDHASSDDTPQILDDVARRHPGKARFHRVRSPRETHEFLKPFAGTPTWVFGVDGDEIYDPAGLARFRRRLEVGEFDAHWVVFGNVLNVTRLSEEPNEAEGHLAPPCRSMTKLFNFSAIDTWNGDTPERLHGGQIAFRPGFHAGLRCSLHETVDWNDADFRCLHLCFVPRSRFDSPGGVRENIMDRHAWSWTKLCKKCRSLVFGVPTTNWKLEKYARGEKVRKSAAAFFDLLPPQTTK